MNWNRKNVCRNALRVERKLCEEKSVKQIGSGKMDICEFWKYVLAQDADKIRGYFHEDAYVNWHCTNEHFSAEEFI